MFQLGVSPNGQTHILRDGRPIHHYPGNHIVSVVSGSLGDVTCRICLRYWGDA